MKTTKEFSWRDNAATRGIPAERAFRELEKIKRKNGSLTAEIIVDTCRNKDHPLHDFFNWDDSAAAELYRRSQARGLMRDIHVTVISDGQEKKIRAYEVTSIDEEQRGNFKSVVSFSVDDIEYVRMSCKRNLIFWRDKISIYSALKSAQKNIENAISELEA